MTPPILLWMGATALVVPEGGKERAAFLLALADSGERGLRADTESRGTNGMDPRPPEPPEDPRFVAWESA